MGHPNWDINGLRPLINPNKSEISLIRSINKDVPSKLNIPYQIKDQIIFS